MPHPKMSLVQTPPLFVFRLQTAPKVQMFPENIALFSLPNTCSHPYDKAEWEHLPRAKRVRMFVRKVPETLAEILLRKKFWQEGNHHGDTDCCYFFWNLQDRSGVGKKDRFRGASKRRHHRRCVRQCVSLGVAEWKLWNCWAEEKHRHLQHRHHWPWWPCLTNRDIILLVIKVLGPVNGSLWLNGWIMVPKRRHLVH